MRREGVLVILSIAVVSTAAAVGSLVSSFYSPAVDPMGLAWQSYGTGYVWVACHSNHRIYQCRTNGSVVRNFASRHGGFTYGLAAGQIGSSWYIWSLGYNPGLIRRFTTTGDLTPKNWSSWYVTI